MAQISHLFPNTATLKKVSLWVAQRFQRCDQACDPTAALAAEVTIQLFPQSLRPAQTHSR
jgi:hypothetical protein